MIISLNWLKKYTAIDLPIGDLAELIGARLVEIESVQYIGNKYKDVVVAKVVECGPLEGSDHLNITKIDDGGKVKDVERDENGLVQVVCGAPNVRAGLLVAWLPPRSTVPETYNSAEPFVLSAKPLRGVMSSGMLASARELDLYDDHTGILEIDKQATPGTSFAELYELDDYLLDIENKSLTHRPDTFGIIGFAREVAGIQGKAFTTPNWLNDLTFETQLDIVTQHPVALPTITIENPALSDRFQAIILSGVDEHAHSPLYIQTYLARCGVRPVNALVDISNYLMLLTGQPSHAYDYHKLKQIAGDVFSVAVRLAHQGETLQLLDGKTITLNESDIVIAAGETAVGLAGVMGGLSTATDTSTKTILFEAATFDLYHLRSSQMRHGIFSEAVTRFTKGIPAALGRPVLGEAARLLAEYSKAVPVSPIIEAYPAPYTPIKVTVTERHINQTLGTEFTAEDIAELLENVGFSVSFANVTATVSVPYWRQDIHLPEDIIEEVGRLAGFETITLGLPTRSFTAVRPAPVDEFKHTLRAGLVRTGATEILTYSFVHGDIFQKVGQDARNAYKVVNSISPDLQYYRQTLTPSLLQHIHSNSKAGYDSFALFECNKVHQKVWGTTNEAVPVEKTHLAFTVSRQTAPATVASAYYEAKSVLDYLLSRLNIAVEYVALPDVSPFEPQRSAYVVSKTTHAQLGVIGEYTKAVQKNFKLSTYTAGFELDIDAVLFAFAQAERAYQPLSRYPSTDRDVCFQVSAATTYADVAQAATDALSTTDLLCTVAPVDIYQSAADTKTKNITLRFTLTSYDATLTTEQVNVLIKNISQAVLAATGGKVV